MARRPDLASLSALEQRDRAAKGEVTSVDIVEAALARIDEREEAVGAWAHLDRELAIKQAEALDKHRTSGKPIGPLHGLAVGIKDIIDTADLPTENGTVLDEGRRPKTDAVVVSRLKSAGAVILGKTVTTELATFHPGKTRNPVNPDHTPGGSSSGSAAAVADNMVPLALGTQTNGSVIRPAAFCGVYGFKPSFGTIPRTGVLLQSPSLDTLGVFARSIADAALIADAIAGFDPGDSATRPEAAPALSALAASEPPVIPAPCFVKTPAWDRAEPEIAEAFAELTDALGDVDEIALPEPFDNAVQLHGIVMHAEIAKSYARYLDKGRDGLSERLAGQIDEGRSILAYDYLVARDWQKVLAESLAPIFDRYDAIITPAAPGPAPEGLGSTGDPIFCTPWQFCGLPAVNLPLLAAGNGLPIGVQLVGRAGFDGRLLRTAGWIVRKLAQDDSGDE